MCCHRKNVQLWSSFLRTYIYKEWRVLTKPGVSKWQLLYIFDIPYIFVCILMSKDLNKNNLMVAYYLTLNRDLSPGSDCKSPKLTKNKRRKSMTRTLQIYFGYQWNKIYLSVHFEFYLNSKKPDMNDSVWFYFSAFVSQKDIEILLFSRIPKMDSFVWFTLNISRQVEYVTCRRTILTSHQFRLSTYKKQCNLLCLILSSSLQNFC